MKDIRTKIAAGATILGLGGLGGYALSSNDASPSAAGAPVAAKTEPKVHTQVIRRTIHVRPDRSGAADATAPDPTPAAVAAPAPTPAVSTTPATAQKPVSTQTSGSSGEPDEPGEEEEEHEGGEIDD